MIKIPKNVETFALRVLRKASLKWYARNKAYEKAKTPNGTFSTGRTKYAWKCATCGELFKKKDTQADHMDPVVPIGGFANGMPVDFNEFIVRLFCSDKNWQILCKSCHKEKSAKEAGDRSVQKKIDKSASK